MTYALIITTLAGATYLNHRIDKLRDVVRLMNIQAENTNGNLCEVRHGLYRLAAGQPLPTTAEE